ncbi:hypothetical protein DD570_30940 [Klebsiella pneumoniae]|nr:hypothetical protein DD570_30940 [Klebsiella pneumoniae]
MPNISLALFSAQVRPLEKQNFTMATSSTSMLRSIEQLHKVGAVRLLVSFRLAYSWAMWRQ